MIRVGIAAAVVFASFALADAVDGSPTESASCPPDHVELLALDEVSGTPLAAVMVTTEGDTFRGDTTVDGRLCVPSRSTLRVTRDGYAEREIVVGTTPAPIALCPLATLEIRLIDGRGPARGSLVRIDEVGRRHEADTDEHGVWTGVVGQAGGRLHIAARGEHTALSCVRIDALVPGRQARTIELRDPASITVSVIDAETEANIDEPRIEWVLDEATNPCPQPLLQATIETVAIDGNRWKARNLAPGHGTVRISAEGYADFAVAASDLEPGSAIDLPPVRLRPNRQVTGQVLGRSGQPTPEVSVRALDPRGEPIATGTTDDDGRFKLEIRDHDRFALQAGRAPGPLSKPIAVDADDSPFRLTLPDPSTIAGRIVTEDDEPISDATILARRFRAHYEDDRQQRRETVSDAHGQFTIDQLGDGAWRVEVRHRSFATRIRAPVQLVPGARIDLEISLGSGATLRGSVVSAEGEPVRGARVWVAESSGTDDGTFSDEKGRFTIDNLARGTVMVHARGPGGASAIQLVDPTNGPVEMTLAPSARVHGSVTDGDGLPLPDRTVSVHRRPIRVQTGADGRYSIDEMPLGRHRLVLERRSLGEHLVLEGRVLTLEPGDEVEVNFVTGTTVSGEVTFNERPVPRAVVTFTRMGEGSVSGNLGDMVGTTRTDADGRYRLEGLRPGPYAASARLDHVEALESVQVDGRTTEIDLSIEGNELHGVVRDAATGEPIANATIELFDPTESGGVAFNSWSIDADSRVDANQVMGRTIVARSGFDGAYALVAGPGSYRLRARAERYTTEGRLIDVVDGQDRTEDLQLQPKGQITGIVRNAWGEPIARALVATTCVGSGETMLAIADLEGFFELDVGAVGRCVLVATVDDRYAALAEGVAAGVATQGDVALVELTVRPAGRIELTLSPGLEMAGPPRVTTMMGLPINDLLRMLGSSPPKVVREDDGGTRLVYPFVPVGEYRATSGVDGTSRIFVVAEDATGFVAF